MNSKLRMLPCMSLPYQQIDLVVRMMVKLYEQIPFLPFLPNISPKDNLFTRTMAGIPGVYLEGKEFIYNQESKTFKNELLQLSNAYDKPTDENISHYSISSVFLEKYYQILTKIKPTATVIYFLGPFSIAQELTNDCSQHLLADKMFRKIIIQSMNVKALWIIKKIQECSPKTLPIIIFDEPSLYKFGATCRYCEQITTATLINLYTKIIQKIKENNCKIGIQSFEKCNWNIPIEAGVDIISFDAYKNPNNLHVVAERLNTFLANGGIINWAICPTNNETLVKELTTDKLQNMFNKLAYSLIDTGVSEKLVFNNSTVSTQGKVEQLPIVYSEKTLILVSQLAKKIPFKR